MNFIFLLLLVLLSGGIVIICHVRKISIIFAWFVFIALTVWAVTVCIMPNEVEQRIYLPMNSLTTGDETIYMVFYQVGNDIITIKLPEVNGSKFAILVIYKKAYYLGISFHDWKYICKEKVILMPPKDAVDVINKQFDAPEQLATLPNN